MTPVPLPLVRCVGQVPFDVNGESGITSHYLLRPHGEIRYRDWSTQPPEFNYGLKGHQLVALCDRLPLDGSEEVTELPSRGTLIVRQEIHSVERAEPAESLLGARVVAGPPRLNSCGASSVLVEVLPTVDMECTTLLPLGEFRKQIDDLEVVAD